MKKIMLLMPCLMLDTNREKNIEAQKYMLEKYKGIDQFVIYDQCYEKNDILNGITYIGKQKEKQGFIKSRNELLKYFYNSDYDYAIWMDGNKTVSKTSLNDFNTLINAIKTDKVDLDVIFSTIGINISPERMEIKKRPDYFKKIYLLYKIHGYEYFHGMFMKNFKKYYDDELYISEECDVWKGLNEDVYFSILLRKLYKTYLCPTIVVNTPTSNTSTWMTNKGSYDYPTVDKPKLKEIAEEESKKHKSRLKVNYKNIYQLDRINDENLKELKPYKSRSSLQKPTIKK